MFVVATQQHAFVDHQPQTPSLPPRLGFKQEHKYPHRQQQQQHQPQHQQVGSQGSEAPISSLLSSPPSHHSMERSASEYSQSGLLSPYPSNCGDTQSEASSVTVDHGSAAQYANQQQEVRSSSNYSTSATPTSEYSVYPHSARSGSFPDHIQRSYHPASNHSGSSGDPSIAAPSPTYPHGQYSPYAPPSQDMSHGYSHPSGGLYAQPRPDWTGYGQQHGAPLTPGHHVFPQTPTSAPPQQRPNQVYSFVPIPGAQQHKRPRRRYEEIERMYKCGWNGCEKAYGTLNHLNAHVTMQSHGQKRTPEEFKEIRKEWKARKKEEEANRKAEEDRQRQAAAAASQNGSGEGQASTEGSQPSSSYPTSRGAVQLPPIGYQPSQYQAPGSTGVQPQLPEYNTTSYMHANYQPASPYGQPNQQMYNQR